MSRRSVGLASPPGESIDSQMAKARLEKVGLDVRVGEGVIVTYEVFL